jgi:integrase
MSLELFDIRASECKDNVKRRNWRLTLPFTLMYLTGCRPADLFSTDNWIITIDNKVVLQPKKGNNNRFFDDPEILDTITEYKAIFHNIKPSINYGRFYTAVKPYVPFNLQNYSKKWVVTYLFRYSYCYRFLENGGTLQELEIELGHKNLKSTLSYYLNII